MKLHNFSKARLRQRQSGLGSLRQPGGARLRPGNAAFSSNVTHVMCVCSVFYIVYVYIYIYTYTFIVNIVSIAITVNLLFLYMYK